MSFPILIDKRAIDYYDDKSPGLGIKFENTLHSHIEKLKLNPFFQIRYDNVRCLPLRKFPYMIHFTIDETEKLVIIRAVFNTHLNPNIWNERS